MEVSFCHRKYQLPRIGCVPLTIHDPIHGLTADSSILKWNQTDWKDLSYTELAFKILSLYISTEEVPAADLKGIIDRSYSNFRAKDVVPLVHLHDDLYLTELFHGPSYSFKDCE